MEMGLERLIFHVDLGERPPLLKQANKNFLKQELLKKWLWIPAI